jgi:hypothetical protein
MEGRGRRKWSAGEIGRVLLAYEKLPIWRKGQKN